MKFNNSNSKIKIIKIRLQSFFQFPKVKKLDCIKIWFQLELGLVYHLVYDRDQSMTLALILTQSIGTDHLGHKGITLSIFGLAGPKASKNCKRPQYGLGSPQYDLGSTRYGLGSPQCGQSSNGYGLG